MAPSLARLTLSLTLILSSFILNVVVCFTPPPRFAQTSTFTGDKIYYMGGVVPPELTISDFFYLDISALKSTASATLPWTELQGLNNMFSSWGTAVAGGANNDLFVLFGGILTSVENNTLVFVYDTNNNTWFSPEISGNAPARKQHTQAVIDSSSKMYIFGGSTVSDNSLVNDMVILDTVNWSWGTGTQNGAPDARDNFSATILNNGIIIYIGGNNLNNNYVSMSQIDTYNTLSDTWARMVATGDTPDSRGGHSAVLTSDGRIIIYGGVYISVDGQYNAVSTELAVLETANNNFVWSKPEASGTKPPQIAYHSALLVGDYMIVSFGNITNIGSSSDVYFLDTKDNNAYKWITSQDIYAASSGNKSSKVGLIVGITFGIVGLILLGGGLFWFYRRRKMMENVIATPGEFTDAGFVRRYEAMNSTTTSQTSHDLTHLGTPNTDSDPSKEFHPSYSYNFPVQHDPEIEDDKEFRILPQELQPEYLEKRFNNDNYI